MKRTRAAFVVLALLAAVQLVAACNPRDAVGDSPGEDAKRGAAVGLAIGGPEGAAIGSLVSVALGVFIRSREKRALRRKGLLTDRIDREAITAKIHRHPAPPSHVDNASGLYPQQSLPATSEIDHNGH